MNLFTVYHEFFNEQDAEKLIKELNELNVDHDWTDNLVMMSNEYIDSVKLLASYLTTEGFSLKYKNGAKAGSYIYDDIVKSQPFLRLAFSETAINSIVDSLVEGDLPTMEFMHSKCLFDGKLRLSISKPENIRDFVYDGFMTFLIGFPLRSYEAYEQIKLSYILSSSMSPAILYENIGKPWLNQVLVDMYRFGMDAATWCMLFDGTWFDLSNQIGDSFISMFNPKKATEVTCISQLYIGDYFVTNMLTFKHLYEEDLLDTIKFTDRKVNVQSMDKTGKLGDIKQKTLRVPVYYEDGEEYLVSDLISEDFVYNEVFSHDIGKGL